MRVLALGSCRVHDPLVAAQRRGDIDFLNTKFKRRQPIYLHAVEEAIQFVRLVRGEIDMPPELVPFAYHGGLHRESAIRAMLDRADWVVVEACTDKHYEAGGWTLNVNEIHARLVAGGGDAARQWWDAIDLGQRTPEMLARRIEAELCRSWRGRLGFGAGHRRVLRELGFRYLSTADIAHGLGRLRTLVAKPLLVVPHIAVTMADGSYLAERLQHVEKTIAAAHQVGLPILDPRRFVTRDGQARALAEAGTDFHHYARDYLPLVGREIVEALSSINRPSDPLSQNQRM